MDDKRVKVWQQIGAGDPPLLWELAFWPDAARDCGFLSEEQYWHVADQLKDLAREEVPSRSQTLDVGSFEDFWAFKDKHGVLGKINLRVYFATDPENKRMVVLGVIKKEDEEQLRKSVVIRLKRRYRLYLLSIGKTL